MSSILRTGKFIRCFTSAARTILNPPKPNENNLVHNTSLRPISTLLSQSWNKHGAQTQTDSLEPLLQRLDSDVKKFGRLSRKDLDEMMEEIRQKHYVSSSQSLLIIRCCGDLVPEELPEVRTKLVKEIWKTLVDRGVPMDISHYNALLRVYIENEHNFSPEDFLKELEGKGIQPNRVTYQRLMWRYCQHGDVEGASRILELMRSNQLPLSNSVLDALVLGHARLGDAAGARAVVTAMANAGLEPGPRTYALLAGCSGGRGDTEELKKTLQESNEKEIYLSDKDLMDVIEDCAVGGHEENIEFLLGQMQHTAGYNTDAITLIFRLIALGRDRAALQVYKSLSKPANPVSDSNSNMYQGAFFIKQLVKAKRPIEVIVSMCRELQEDGSIPKAYVIACDAALYHGNEELALGLFDILKSTGDSVRQHYFWPLIVAHGKKNNPSGVLNLLKVMTANYGLGIWTETLRDYVLPYLKKSDPDRLFTQLREQNVIPNIAGKMIVNSLLSENKLKEAAQFTAKYGIINNLNLCRGNLVKVLNSYNDIDSFVKIIHSGYNKDSFGRVPQNSPDANEESVEEGDDHTQAYRSVVGNILVGFVRQSPSQALPILPTLLETLHSKGIGITVISAERIQEQLGGNLTNSISEALAKLTVDDLEPEQIYHQPLPAVRQTPESLERLISNLEASNKPVSGLKKRLLIAYASNKQFDKMEELMESLTKENFVFTSGLFVVMQDVYAQEENLDKALAYYTKVIETDPGFIIDDLKILRLVNLLIVNDQYDRAMEILESQSVSKEKESHTFVYNSLMWRTLNSLAEKGDYEKLKKIFDTMVDKKYLKPSNVLLGPLIKVYLVKEDMENALREFERICKDYKCTPMKNELTKKLISSEDAAGLQKLTDLSTLVHGEVNSLYDLVFGFVECGRVRQARKILETPGMRTRNQRFNYACERYGQEGKTDYLEGLLEATRELSHIDRSEVFQQLLNTYIKEEDVEKSIGLWTIIQEESEAPTDKFLLDLADFLTSKNVKIPFVVPEKKPEKITPVNKPISTNDSVQRKMSTNEIKIKESSKLWQALQQNNVEQALSLWRQTPHAVSRAEVSNLIEILVKDEKLDIATEVVTTSFKFNIGPLNKVLRFLLNSLAAGGDSEKIEIIGQVLSQDQKRTLSFDNRKYNSLVKSEGVDKILTDLNERVNSETDAETLRYNFPTGAFLGFLTDNPDHFPKFLELAEKYHNKGVHSPANMLWTHYIITGQDDKAEGIWNKYLSQCETVMFKKLLNESRFENSTRIVDRVLHHLKSSKVPAIAMGIVYSAKIDILCNQNKLQESEQVLQEALSSGCTLEDINRTALFRLKTAVELDGRQFNYEIPMRRKTVA